MGLLPRLLQITAAVIAAPAIIALLIISAERALGRRPRTAARVRPWVWLLPAFLLSGAILVYPMADTVLLSLRRADGTGWAGLSNYAWSVSSALLPTLRNNALWLVLVPAVTIALGLAVAVLGDKVRYERIIRTLVLIPAGISFAAAGVIWRLMYEYKPPSAQQTGTVDGVLGAVGVDPVPWVADPSVATYALIFVGCWMTLGTTALILSAGVKNIPGELIEAARLDGAGEWRIFRSVTLPTLWPSVLVALTTQVIFALKVFDIVYVMTNGQFDTDVAANRIYAELFVANNFGHASALAVILLIISSPVMFLNIRQFRQEATAR
ncbi:sugar ABC transporter permease [Streptomyces phaeochromogenes]|uniref:Sugar ABC transporter permease n=1 Tax=Streptomyces phaeochromogenes TaxID=1923 RepID=A0ABZ1HM91_STRPH|nr:sugar ABC transporter permease [Streptomyces phaeochromogenes]WSD19724.1 sugar ABC transporter permease [Streptomyces phaeochromogenes]